MTGRQVATAVGAGITTALVVGAVVTELLAVEFSAIVGLPVGLLAGMVVASLVFSGRDGGRRPVLDAYAGFGLAVLALLALRYVNVGRSVLSMEVILALAGLTAGVVYATGWHLARDRA